MLFARDKTIRRLVCTYRRPMRITAAVSLKEFERAITLISIPRKRDPPRGSKPPWSLAIRKPTTRFTVIKFIISGRNDEAIWCHKSVRTKCEFRKRFKYHPVCVRFIYLFFLSSLTLPEMYNKPMLSIAKNVKQLHLMCAEFANQKAYRVPRNISANR